MPQMTRAAGVMVADSQVMSVLAAGAPELDLAGHGFVVRGPSPLDGTVEVSGAKNSVLKLMAATLLAEGTYRIANVPRITDVGLMAELLRAIGCKVTLPGQDVGPEQDIGPKQDVGPKQDTDAVLIIEVPAEIEPVAPRGIVDQFRASIEVLGPMLARCGEAVVALPGGDDFGPRPIDMHLQGLAKLGVEAETVDGYVHARARELRGGAIRLDFPSVGATENLLMAAVRAKGTTVIDNAAREPEVADLCEFLSKMGAQVSGSGSGTLTINGVDHVEALQPVDHSVVGDRIVAATYLAALGIATGEIVVTGVDLDHMAVLCGKLGDMGMEISAEGERIRACVSRRLSSAKFSTLPYPGVATDLKPLLVALLATADGVGSVTENLFAERFRYVDDLRLMGADIRIDSHHVVVEGKERLMAAKVKAPDIRAGAALVIAGLGAQGETTVSDAHHIARGYDDLAGKLNSLGADVSRC
ncbi:MAG: UDP-N-acetylglucosamine 1-carboxyvinyltransferase [Acidimicrobiaceae bacterium]|nr:UDP-N-acetylglucosamine 1-carboxyvinyltransferase [Acidimicrobiaceae bacterium]